MRKWRGKFIFNMIQRAKVHIEKACLRRKTNSSVGKKDIAMNRQLTENIHINR